MRRFQLLEILDQRWCPQPVRDGATDCLEAITAAFDAYGTTRPRMLDAIRRCEATQVVDLCSGGGGPWLSKPWLALLEREPGLRVVLTDKFPSHVLAERLTGCQRIVAIDVSVDAVNVLTSQNGERLPDLHGFRTIFSSFHHFSDAMAARLLEDAVRNGDGLASAEVTSRSRRAILTMLLMPLFVWVLTPRMRPFRWSRLLLTYLLPAIPLVILFDGLVSCLRTRTPEELLTLARPYTEYEWTAGYGEGAWLPPVFLIGVPRERA